MNTPGLDQTSEGWDAAAPVYAEAFEPLTLAFAEEAVDFARINEGESILDVAAGTGALAKAALKRGAIVSATDFAPEMVDRLRATLGNEARVYRMDGHHLGFADNTFDAAFSCFGLIFFSDRKQGLGEIFRVLKPGGRAVIAGWGPPKRFEAIQVLMSALRKVFPDMPRPKEIPPAYCYRDPETLRSEMQSAGFENVATRSVTKVWAAKDGESLWQSIRHFSPAVAHLFLPMSREDVARVERHFKDSLGCAAGRGKVELAVEAHLGLGEKRGG